MTTTLPPVTIVATTWFPESDDGLRRGLNACAAFASWREYLIYEGSLCLHVADDGSPEDRLALLDPELEHWAHVTISVQARRGVGASLNAGLRQAFDHERGLALYAVDDWALTGPIDLTPWARLLWERADVGMVRLGPPHPDLTGRVEALTGDWQGWALRLDRHHYAFGHRPALYHPRLRDAYGLFAEGVNAYDCERLYAEQFARTTGPDIVLALPHPWWHLEGPEQADVVPGP